MAAAPNSVLAAQENFQAGNSFFGTPAGTGQQQPQWLLNGSVTQTSELFSKLADPVSPADGLNWYSSSTKGMKVFTDGIIQAPTTTLFTQSALGTAYNTSTTATSIVGATGVGTMTVPANFMVVGKVLRLRLVATMSTTSTPNLTIAVKFGATSIVTTGAVATTTVTSAALTMEVLLIAYAIGSSGATIAGAGSVNMGGTFGSLIITTAASADTTVASLVDVIATWGTSSASNNLQSIATVLECLN